jgi:diguanylate cyclase (GGDEF)-like protein
LLLFSAASLPAQIATREALLHGIGRGRANLESSSGLPEGDRNALIFQGFARLRNSLATKDSAATTAAAERILTAADAIGDEATLRLVYSELAETLSRAENTSGLILERDHALQQDPVAPHFPHFQIFSSLAGGFRELHDDPDADAAYDLAGRHLTGQPDPVVATHYSSYAAVLISGGRLDRALDCYQRARAIYRRIGPIPTQLLVDSAELELSLKRFDAAQDSINQALQLTSPADSLNTRFSVQETSARVLIARRQFTPALESIHRAEALVPRGDFRLQHFAFALYHQLYFDTRNYPALLANDRAMLASAQLAGNQQAITYSEGLLGLALGLNGKVDEGIQLIDQAAAENLGRHSSRIENLEQKYQVYEAAHRYPEALIAYREFRDARQEWNERTNHQSLSRLESSLALEKSEQDRRELLAQEQIERNRRERDRLENLNLLRQEQLRAADAERLSKDDQITTLRAQGQLVAAEKMRQQLVQAQSNQQFQLDSIARRSQLKSALAALLLVCLLLAVALAWALWRANLARKQQALEDPLTGLKNRRFLAPFMELETQRLRRNRQTALILMADIDHFKSVNDRWGHDVGDKALLQLAEILRHCVRNSDVISRWGGEEFVIVCPESNEAHAEVICNRIRQHLRKTPVNLPGVTDFHLTISIGAALFSPCVQDEHWQLALERADHALYQVKHNGRDNWSLAASHSTQPSAAI